MSAKTDMLKAVFLAALEKPTAAERSAYLDQVCALDPALHRDVEALLRAHEHDDPLLDRPAAEHLEGPAGAHTEPLLSLDFLGPPKRPNSLGRIGHYEVLEVLGRGGFGIVFRAFDEILERVVAIKVLAPAMAATSPPRKRFLREARSSAKVRHEHIVQVYAVEEQPLPYLVMEFIPGENLQQRLDRIGPLEATEAAEIGRQIAAALAAAHSTGLIHRDVKPANILLEAGPNQRVKITDFGLARAVDDASLTQSGLLAGTPMYMSPEQAHGHKLDVRADLFSLGSVLYTMCTGRPPFRANGTLAVLKRVAEDTPRPIQEIIPEVPPWLCDVVRRLHAKRPEDRFGSAREVADVLGRGLAARQHPGQTLPEVAPCRESPDGVPAKRGPRVRLGGWVVAATVLLLLLGGLSLTEAIGVTDFRGTVIRLFAPAGTLVVEVDDPGVSVKIDGSDLVITGAGAKEIRLKPGSYTVEARKDGKLVSRELITVARNGRQIVRVSQELAKAPPVVEAKLPATFTNHLGMEFVLVPRGKSWLGGGKDMLGDKEVEIPVDFYLGKYEITQEEWTRVMSENPSHFSRHRSGREAVKDIDDADLQRFPVEYVSWHQCRIFLEKLNRLEKETGWLYRLPTEVEWEYACRGGPMSDKLHSAFDFYFAEPTNAPLTTQANFNNGLNRTCKVGSYAPNALGLHDMHGNVWEWCEDIANAPKGVYRGGDWLSDAVHCRAAFFFVYSLAHRDTRLGLRVARVPSAQGGP